MPRRGVPLEMRGLIYYLYSWDDINPELPFALRVVDPNWGVSRDLGYLFSVGSIGQDNGRNCHFCIKHPFAGEGSLRALWTLAEGCWALLSGTKKAPGWRNAVKCQGSGSSHLVSGAPDRSVKLKESVPRRRDTAVGKATVWHAHGALCRQPRAGLSPQSLFSAQQRRDSFVQLCSQSGR